jgi:hypothetical protein
VADLGLARGLVQLATVQLVLLGLALQALLELLLPLLELLPIRRIFLP